MVGELILTVMDDKTRDFMIFLRFGKKGEVINDQDTRMAAKQAEQP